MSGVITPSHVKCRGHGSFRSIYIEDQSAFLVTVSSNTVQTNIAGSSTVTLKFDTIIFDRKSDFNVSTYTFTAPVDGYYPFYVNVRLDDLSTESNVSWYTVYLVTSNRTYSTTLDFTLLTSLPDFTNGYTFNLNILGDMEKNDTAIIQARQEGGTGTADFRVESWFSGFLAVRK